MKDFLKESNKINIKLFKIYHKLFIYILWLSKLNFAPSVSGKSIQEKELDMLLKTADHSYSFQKEQEISAFGK